MRNRYSKVTKGPMCGLYKKKKRKRIVWQENVMHFSKFSDKAAYSEASEIPQDTLNSEYTTISFIIVIHKANGHSGTSM